MSTTDHVITSDGYKSRALVKGDPTDAIKAERQLHHALKSSNRAELGSRRKQAKNAWRNAQRMALRRLAGRYGLKSLAQMHSVLAAWQKATNAEPINWKAVKANDKDFAGIDDQPAEDGGQ